MLVIMLDKDKFDTVDSCGKMAGLFKKDAEEDNILTIPRVFADAYYIDEDERIVKL